MPIYKNEKTGNVIETKSKVSGGDWVELKKTAPKQPDKQ